MSRPEADRDGATDHDRIEVWSYPSTPSYPDSPTLWAWSCCDENEGGYDTAVDALDAVCAHLTKAGD